MDVIGRFPQVSNIKFTFDPAKPSGSRIIAAQIGGEDIDPERKYTMATRGYMSRGKGIPLPPSACIPGHTTADYPILTPPDGYKALLVQEEGGEAEELVDEENGMLISTMLRQYFMALRTLGKWKYLNAHWEVVATAFTPIPTPPTLQSGPRRTRDSVPASGAWKEWLARRAGIGIEPEEESEPEDEAVDGEEDKVEFDVLLMRKYFARWASRAGVKGNACDSMAEDAVEVDWTRVIAPLVEGRITMIE